MGAACVSPPPTLGAGSPRCPVYETGASQRDGPVWTSTPDTRGRVAPASARWQRGSYGGRIPRRKLVALAAAAGSVAAGSTAVSSAAARS